MHISVTDFAGLKDVFSIEVAPDLTVIDLKALIEAESDFGIKANEMNLYCDGKLVQNENQTLEQANVKDYDVLICQQKPPNSPMSPTTGVPGIRLLLNPNNPQQLMNELRANPLVLQRLRQNYPQLGDAVDRQDMNAFMQFMASRATPVARSPASSGIDLYDPTIQRRIEEAINMENVLDNMEHAYEHAPEFFGNVIMLYINCKINGHPVKAFVDSGAQVTIMSKECAERCEIMRLVDIQFAGIARGVGTQRILGRIHLAQLEIENKFFATSLSVLEDQKIDMLIGLDMLRRHRCVIDLNRNVLRLENSVETVFLPESELPTYARLTGNTPDVQGQNIPQSLSNATTASPADNCPQQRSNQQVTSISTASSLTPAPFPEKDIIEITKKGFTREEAIEELKSTNGDVTKALVILMAKSLAKPRQKK